MAIKPWYLIFDISVIHAVSKWCNADQNSSKNNILRDVTCFLTHWGRVTHICVSKLTIIGSDNGLSPGRRQAIIWTSVGIMLIAPLGTNFGEILIEILTFSFKKMRLKVSSVKRRPFCLGLNVLKPSVTLWSLHYTFYYCKQQLSLQNLK